MLTKSKGQILYEKLHPSHIQVIRADISFPTAADIMLVPNPVHHAPWQLLTEKCRAYYEAQAIGHHLTS